jgi:hypothetical protein
MRHLGLIKAMAIIMAVLIVAALVVIVTTIYSRLTNAKMAKAVTETEVVIPPASRVSGAASDEKGGLTLVIEGGTGQQVWQLDSTGQVRRKTRIIAEK